LLFIFRTHNGRGLETALHRWLRKKGRKKSDAVGSEWFYSTAVEALELCRTLKAVGKSKPAHEPKPGEAVWFSCSIDPDADVGPKPPARQG
jgi:hypothetical protein